MGKGIAIAFFMIAAVLGAEEICELNSDEIAFTARLADRNRKIFVEKLDPRQRAAVMVAVKNGTAADEAVYRMHTATEITKAEEDPPKTQASGG